MGDLATMDPVMIPISPLAKMRCCSNHVEVAVADLAIAGCRRSLRNANKAPPVYNLGEQPKEKKQTGGDRKKRKRAERVFVKNEDAKLNRSCLLSPEVANDVESLMTLPVDQLGTFSKPANLLVKERLRLFNTCYLQSVQLEQRRVQDKQEERKRRKKLKLPPQKNDKSSSKRPDLKATKMILDSIGPLHRKRIGATPGIDVGDKFYSRAEMVVLGIHSHWLNGIDFIGKSYKYMPPEYKEKKYKFPVATCIVLSGGYEDNFDCGEEITYTGEGGNDLLGNKKQIADQKMSKGNLALRNSKLNDTAVRVIRGHSLKASITGKVYTYDGLYKVVDDWAAKGVSGHVVYKFKLKRISGQKTMTTSQVNFARGKAPTSTDGLAGLVCKDISNGQERLPIPATNVVDDPPFAPDADGFVYTKMLKVSENIRLPDDIRGCDCNGDCSESRNCSCAKLNGGEVPFVKDKNGYHRLIEARSVVFECGANCKCSANCINRTSQQGLQFRLEVFKTPGKGWGVRSWDTIPAGAPICEYVGLLRRSDELDCTLDSTYAFDIDCLQTMKGLDGREKRPGDVSLFPAASNVVEYCIDAKSEGNVARFINHSCQPNLFVQSVLSSHHDCRYAKIMLYAADTILPLQELTYDYGYQLDTVLGPDGKITTLDCYCGAPECRKRLY